MWICTRSSDVHYQEGMGRVDEALEIEEWEEMERRYEGEPLEMLTVTETSGLSVRLLIFLTVGQIDSHNWTALELVSFPRVWFLEQSNCAITIEQCNCVLAILC